MKMDILWGNPFKRSATDPETEIDFLSAVTIFDDLSSRQLSKLHRIIHVRRFEESEIVFRQGDPGVGMYLVREGQIVIYTEHPDMTRHKITDMKKGDFFGEIALLNDSPRSATAIASRKSTLLGLFRPDLLSLMESDPKLGLRFIYRLSQIVAERLRLLNTNVMD